MQEYSIAATRNGQPLTTVSFVQPERVAQVVGDLRRSSGADRITVYNGVWYPRTVTAVITIAKKEG